MSDDAITFVCTDCERDVITWEYPRISVCVVCLWVRQHVPSHEQVAVRERLGVPVVSTNRAQRNQF